jgi:hypothetical protein
MFGHEVLMSLQTRAKFLYRHNLLRQLQCQQHDLIPYGQGLSFFTKTSEVDTSTNN